MCIFMIILIKYNIIALNYCFFLDIIPCKSHVMQYNVGINNKRVN